MEVVNAPTRSAATRWEAGRSTRRPVLSTRSRGIVGIVGLIALWELVPLSGLVSMRYFPPFHEVAAALGAGLASAEYWQAVRLTVQSWFLGLLIAFVAAAVIGLILGSTPFLWRHFESTIEFLRPIPSVALIPLAVLMYGITARSALLLIVYATFWQVLTQVMYGVKDVDRVAMATAKVFGFSRWARIRYVAWPTALPYIATGFRLGASVALVLALTAELVIGNPGIGNEIALAQSAMALPEMYALVVTAGALGVLINVGVRAAERRVLSWHESIRSEKR